MNSNHSMQRRSFLRQSVGLLAAAAMACPYTVAAKQVDPLFSLSLPDNSGAVQPLSRWLGQPVVVNFWATWCPPCVKEMPDLDTLSQQFKEVHFLGLAVDTASNVKRFTQKIQVDYPLLLIGHDGINTMRTLGNKQGGLPFTVVFNAQGQVAETVLGQIKPDQLQQTLQTLL